MKFCVMYDEINLMSHPLELAAGTGDVHGHGYGAGQGAGQGGTEGTELVGCEGSGRASGRGGSIRFNYGKGVGVDCLETEPSRLDGK
jgi:hypothetical protein